MYIMFSRSRRAQQAEEVGLLPASRLARLLGGVSSRAIAEVLLPVEWHHTGCLFRRTDYYSIAEAQAQLEELRDWTRAAARISRAAARARRMRTLYLCLLLLIDMLRRGSPARRRGRGACGPPATSK